MEMCSTIGVNLQRGMNFRLRDGESIILMSLRKGAPYADRIEDEGRLLIYEGHDVARTAKFPNPKKVDQPDPAITGCVCARRSRMPCRPSHWSYVAMIHENGKGVRDKGITNSAGHT